MSARTFGLTHLALAVRDPERSLAFGVQRSFLPREGRVDHREADRALS
jgi:hypothetical protein